MSTRSNYALFGQSEDPREVELVQNLIEKTRQGKIPWNRQTNALIATIPNSFQINFYFPPSL